MTPHGGETLAQPPQPSPGRHPHRRRAGGALHAAAARAPGAGPRPRPHPAVSLVSPLQKLPRLRAGAAAVADRVAPGGPGGPAGEADVVGPGVLLAGAGGPRRAVV